MILRAQILIERGSKELVSSESRLEGDDEIVPLASSWDCFAGERPTIIETDPVR